VTGARGATGARERRRAPGALRALPPGAPGAAPRCYVFVGIVRPAPSADSFGSGQRADIVLIFV